MIEISPFQCLQVMSADMRVALDFIQCQAERFTALVESLPDAVKMRCDSECFEDGSAGGSDSSCQSGCWFFDRLDSGYFSLLQRRSDQVRQRSGSNGGRLVREVWRLLLVEARISGVRRSSPLIFSWMRRDLPACGSPAGSVRPVSPGTSPGAWIRSWNRLADKGSCGRFAGSRGAGGRSYHPVKVPGTRHTAAGKRAPVPAMAEIRNRRLPSPRAGAPGCAWPGRLSR